MSTRTAVQYGALAGMITYGAFIAITPSLTLVGTLADLYLAIVVPVFIIHQAGMKK